MRRYAVAASALTALAAAACDQAGEPAQDSGSTAPESVAAAAPPIREGAPTQVITVGGDLGAAVTGPRQVVVRGEGEVTVESTDLFGGAATVARGPSEALPRAIEFPPYVATDTYPVAILRLTPQSDQSMDPGTSDFRFGAVFRVDPTSSGRTIDDGDNLFQRGLYSDSSMFKLEVDDHRPSCTVKGSAGQVIVRSANEVTPGTWYRVSCTRTADRLAMTVTPQEGDAATPASKATPGATGELSFPVELPAALGGKLDKLGGIVIAASDQFNGAVALVKYRRL